VAWYDTWVVLVEDAWAWFLAEGHAGRRWLLFFLLLTVTWIVARLGSRLVTRRLVRLRRVEPAVVQLLGSLFVFLTVVAGIFIYSSTVFGANVAGLAATLGLVSLALGFGFQNTIANVAGGISLALDRPFRLGDQIRVGELVGDVQEIGIRSTRVLTARKEYVVIPNKYLESEPITNYTMVYPEFRLDVPVNVPADVDRQQVEDIMVEVALAHPVVLRRPLPRVLLRRFLGPVLHLELRCWISHPRDRALVESDLLKSMSDRFEAEGIHLPRATAQGSGTAAPKQARRGSFVRSSPASRRLLVPLLGSDPSLSRTGYATALAKALHGQLVGLYVTDPRRSRAAPEEGGRALHVLETVAGEAGIWFKPILRETDDPVAAILEAAKEEDVDVVVLGVGRGRSPVEWRWRKEEPTVRAKTLRERGLACLVHEVPPDARLQPRIVQQIEAELAQRGGAAATERHPPVVVSPPEPRTSAVPSPPPEEPAADRRPEPAAEDAAPPG
jgi:small-conductance mechanosensitive channel/nucleotide-binding universal stress UspA family protein